MARDCFDMGLFRMGLFWHGTVLDGTVLTRDCFDMGLFWFGTVLVWDCLGGTVSVGLFWFGTVSYCSPKKVPSNFPKISLKCPSIFHQFVYFFPG